LSKTAEFTSYTNADFNDDNQIELANYTKELSEKGARILLSNSDPKNTNPNDEFFDELYKPFSINRISAKRSINRNAKDRGKISELLVCNY
jgi:DNA adenine methylase